MRKPAKNGEMYLVEWLGVEDRTEEHEKNEKEHIRDFFGMEHRRRWRNSSTKR